MPRSESRTKTGIWSDPDFTGRLTMRAQRTYWMLYSQATISLAGVVAMRVKRWADTAKDASITTVIEDLAELEAEDYIQTDPTTEEVLVRTFARHDGVYKSPRTLSAAWQQLSWIDSARLREAARTELMGLWELAEKEGYRIPRRPWKPVDEPVENLGITSQTGLFDTPSDTPSDRASDTPCDTPPDRHRARRARTPTPTPTPSPTPSTVAAAPSQTPDPAPQDGDRDWATPEDQDTASLDVVALGHRMAAACVGNRSRTVGEAHGVISWALTWVDPALVEQVVEWAEGLQGESRVVLPRAIAGVIQRKAAGYGIAMPPFDPQRRLG